MNRKKQIEEASNSDNIVYFDNKPEFNFSLMEAFRWGAQWADANPPQDTIIIKWKTGEPKEEGVYIVTTLERKIGIASFFKGFQADEDFFKDCVLAWCKLSDIKPYKEE